MIAEYLPTPAERRRLRRSQRLERNLQEVLSDYYELGGQPSHSVEKLFLWAYTQARTPR